MVSLRFNGDLVAQSGLVDERLRDANPAVLVVLLASVWVEVQAAAVEVDRGLEVLPVAVAAGGPDMRVPTGRPPAARNPGFA